MLLTTSSCLSSLGLEDLVTLSRSFDSLKLLPCGALLFLPFSRPCLATVEVEQAEEVVVVEVVVWDYQYTFEGSYWRAKGS